MNQNQVMGDSESTSSVWKKQNSKKNRKKNVENPSVRIVPSNFTQNPLEFIHCQPPAPENINSAVEGFDINKDWFQILVSIGIGALGYVSQDSKKDAN
jgi:hypothetical protein